MARSVAYGLGQAFGRMSVLARLCVVAGCIGVLALCTAGPFLGEKPTQGPRVVGAANPEPAPSPRDHQRGTAATMAKVLKGSMKNPDSFALEEALFMPDGSACYTYRATNSFNAVDRGAAVFDGMKLVTSDNKRAFRPLWKKICDGKSGEDISAYVRMFVL